MPYLALAVVLLVGAFVYVMLRAWGDQEKQEGYK